MQNIVHTRQEKSAVLQSFEFVQNVLPRVALDTYRLYAITVVFWTAEDTS